MEDWLRQTNRLIPSPGMTVAAMMDAYLDRCIEKGRASSTIGDYRRQIENHINPTIGHIRIDELSPYGVERMCQGIAGKKAAGNVRATLRAAINKIARKADPQLGNAAALADPPAYRRRARVQITWESVAKILAAEEDPLWRAHWLLLAQTGMRPKSVRELTWTEIVRRPDGLWVQLAASKTPEGLKPRPIPPEAAAALDALPRTSVYVFPCPHGGPCNATTIGKYWRAVRDRAGLPPCTLYQLRHLYGSHIARTASEEVLRSLMAHTDVRTTRQYYVEAFPADLRKAANAVRVRPTKPHNSRRET